jgi:hypothetical protein
VLSIGIFFTLLILGLSGSLEHALAGGLAAHGVPGASAARIAKLPPVSVLFAAFLGYNPVKELVGSHVLSHLSAANSAALTGRGFFPDLISGPFHDGLHEAFLFSIIACLLAAAASWWRGARYVHGEAPEAAPVPAGAPGPRPAARRLEGARGEAQTSPGVSVDTGG